MLHSPRLRVPLRQALHFLGLRRECAGEAVGQASEEVIGDQLLGGRALPGVRLQAQLEELEQAAVQVAKPGSHGVI